MNYIVLAFMIAVAIYAAYNFTGQIEVESSTNEVKTDLGIAGRLFYATVFFIPLLVVYFLSKKVPPVGLVLCAILSCLIAIANNFLNKRGFKTTYGAFALWIVSFLVSLFVSNISAFKVTLWSVVYVVFQLILGVLICLGTASGKLHRIILETKRRIEESEDTEEDVASIDIDSPNLRGTEPRTDTAVSEDDDDEGNELSLADRLDNFLSRRWARWLVWGIFIIIVVLVFVWLECKFDYFPPFNS